MCWSYFARFTILQACRKGRAEGEGGEGGGGKNKEKEGKNKSKSGARLRTLLGEGQSRHPAEVDGGAEECSARR